MSEEGKAVFNILKSNSPVDLNDLKPNQVYPIKNGIRQLRD